MTEPSEGGAGATGTGLRIFLGAGYRAEGGVGVAPLPGLGLAILLLLAALLTGGLLLLTGVVVGDDELD